MFIVGYKLDHQLLYKSGIYSENEPSDNIVIQNIIASRGGIESDFSIFRIDNHSTVAERILNGDEFNLVWSDVEPNGIISNIDFTPEDSKLWIKFYAVNGKIEILANDMDYTDFMIEVWKADKSGIAVEIDGTENIPIMTPRGLAEMRCQFQNGLCLRRIRTQIFGEWIFPANSTRFNGYRIYNTLKIKSLVPFV